jgi:hypothetical protein
MHPAAPRLPAEHLVLAREMAEEARRQLQMAYRLLQPHHLLSIHCETAGKTARQLSLAIDAREKGIAA